MKLSIHMKVEGLEFNEFIVRTMVVFVFRTQCSLSKMEKVKKYVRSFPRTYGIFRGSSTHDTSTLLLLKILLSRVWKYKEQVTDHNDPLPTVDETSSVPVSKTHF